MTAGNKNAPKVEAPKPLVEKVGETKPVEDPTAKVVEKKEVKAAREAAPPPEPKPAEPKPRSKKKAENQARPDRRSAGRRTRRRSAEPKKVEAKPPDPAARSLPRRRPSSIPRRSRRCSTSAIRPGSRPPATPSTTPPRSACLDRRAAQMSLSELDALRQRLAQLWTPPAGAKNPQELVVLFRIKLKPDGTLAGSAAWC